jgi:hypothetical protein
LNVERYQSQREASAGATGTTDGLSRLPTSASKHENVELIVR